MKTFFIYVSVLLFSSLLCHAQTADKQISALHSEIKKVKTSTQKVSAMLKLGNFYLDQNEKIQFPKAKDSALLYFDKAEKIAKTLKNPESLGDVYSAKIKLYEKDSLATEYAKKAVAIFKKTNNKAKICKASTQIITAMDMDEKMVDAAAKMLPLCRECKDKESEGNLLESIAYCYMVKADYTTALTYLEKSLKAYSAVPQGRARDIYSFIAGLYTEMGEQEKALQLMLKAVALTEKVKNPTKDDARIYNMAGLTYMKMKNHEVATGYFEKALKIARNFDDPDTQMLVEGNLSTELFELKRDKEAMVHIRNIEKNYDRLMSVYKHGALYLFIKAYVAVKDRETAEKYVPLAIAALKDKDILNMGIIRLESALIRYYFFIGDYSTCRSYALDYKNRSEEVKSKEKAADAYQMLYQLDSVQGNYRSALNNYRIAHNYQDSLFNEAKNRQLAETEAKYQIQKKDNDNQLLKKQGELQKTKLDKATLEKNLSLAGILLLIVSMALIYRRYIINRRIKTQTTAKNGILESLLNEKEWLLKEIHHRVKNNLQIVMSLLNTQSHFLKDEAAIEAIKNSQDRIHSMSLLHKKLYQSDTMASINIKQYIEELIAYFKATFDTRNIVFLLDVDPIEISSTQAVPLALIINEALINSLKHAFPDKEAGEIEIIIRELPDSRISVSIKDNGVGTDIDLNSAQFPSLGIKLIKGFSGELNASLNFINDNGLTLRLEFLNNKQFFESEQQSTISA